ncbi:MAG: hypothetical protein K2X93_05660 [Candidatus Obscuribacterales bacterium]|nr:hypothetical protein [Candidatus Obscuribacterales bacterium]
MGANCPLDVRSGAGTVEIFAYDLTIHLEEHESRLLLDWLRESLESTIAFLLRVDCPGLEIEGRNYQNYLDFTIFLHSDEGLMSARTFKISKRVAPEILDKLKRAIELSFTSSNHSDKPQTAA